MSNTTYTYNPAEELQMVKAAQEDPQKFAPIYDAYYKPIFVFVHNRIRDKEIVADLTQQVFLKALLAIKGYEYKGVPFGGWLYRIAINEVNMHFRQKKIIEVEVREKDAVELMQEIGQSSNEIVLKRCLEMIGKLPDDQSQMIEMRFFDHLSFAEIARIYGITEANAKMKLYRILEKLKNELINLRDR